jgi:hypothetical protein
VTSRCLAVFALCLVCLATLVAVPATAAQADRDRGQTTVGKVGLRRTTHELANGPSRYARFRSQAGDLRPRRSGVAKLPTPAAAEAPTSATSETTRHAALTNQFQIYGPDEELNIFPPDTQGDVGPTQFFVTLNTRFRTYSKSGGQDNVIDEYADTFWADEMTPVAAGDCNVASDPHVRYDRLSHRWFIVMVDVPGCAGDQPNRIMIAVSNSSTITASTVWTFFHIIAPSGRFADYPTLGVGAQALYIGANLFSTATGDFIESDGYVVPKPSVLGAGPIVSTRFTLAAGIGPGAFTPQGVDDPYGASSTGYFIGVDNAAYSRLDIVPVADPGGTPSVSTQALDVPATDSPIRVPLLGNSSGGAGELDPVDDRLFAATMTADGHIWTAHNIAVNASGGLGSVDRDGSRWYEIDPATPSLVQSGTVSDTAAVNPISYWIPSLAVSGQGIMAVGGSMSSAATNPGAWYATRLLSDPPGVTDAPVQYVVGSPYHPLGDPGSPLGRRWGDYSLTRVDPVDNQTIWTIQEYASGPNNSWGVTVARLDAPAPPVPSSASATIETGSASTHVTVAGTGLPGQGWYDPGPTFPHRLEVSVGCGVHVNNVSVVSPTQLDLDLDTTSASGGTCTVSTTNPDGQSTSGDVVHVVDYRPSLIIRLASESTYTGSSIYNATAAGQAVTGPTPQGGTQQFVIRMQNRGSVADTYHVAGQGNRAGFTVHYYAGTTDVTSQMMAGTLVKAVPPGGTVDYRLVVSAAKTATLGSTASWLVTATSTHDPTRLDAVKAVVKVVKYRPDALIKLSAAHSYLGGNIYNLTGLNQTVKASRTRGATQTFTVRVENDGTASDLFRLAGPGNRTGFVVHYYSGTTDITKHVVAGTYLSGSIAPAGSRTYRLVVQVTRTASIGATPSWLIKATSTHQTARGDAVRAQIRVIAS